MHFFFRCPDSLSILNDKDIRHLCIIVIIKVFCASSSIGSSKYKHQPDTLNPITLCQVVKIMVPVGLPARTRCSSTPRRGHHCPNPKPSTQPSTLNPKLTRLKVPFGWSYPTIFITCFCSAWRSRFELSGLRV